MFEQLDRGMRGWWVVVMALLTALVPCSTLRAADRVWLGPTGLPPGDGSSFNDPLNWAPNGIPGAADTAIFDGIGGNVGGSVFFGSALTNNLRMVARGNTPPIILLLGGNVYFLGAPDTLGADRPFVLAPNAGDAVDVQVLDGTLLAGDSTVAMAPGTLAAFRVLTGATVIFFGDSAYGENGEALVQIADASSLINAGNATIARNPGSVAEITVDGADTDWSVAGTLDVGGSIDGPGGSASILLTGGAALSAGEELVLHPGATIDFAGSTGDTPLLRASGAGTILTLDATSALSISEGTPSSRAGIAIGDGAPGAVELSDEARLSGEAVFFGAEALVTLDGARIEGVSIDVDPFARIFAAFRPGGTVPGEEALLAASGTAALSATLTMSVDDPPPLLGESIDLVRAGTVDGSFLVTLAPLLGGLNYLDVSSVERSGETRVVAEIKELDLRLAIGEGTNSPLPAPPNLLTVASFGDDETLLDAAVTIPGASTRDPASLVILGNTLSAPGETPGYAETLTIPIGADPKGLDNGDLSGNGRNDIIVSSRGAGTVTIVRNVGDSDAGDVPFEVVQVVDLGGDPAGLSVAEIDGINGPDVVVAQESDGGFVVLFNDGAGLVAAGTLVPTGTGPGAVDPNDVDDDKDIDVIVMNAGNPKEEGSATVTVHVNLLAENRGNFAGFAPPVAYSIGLAPVALASGDLNGDGFPEIVTANAGDGTLSLLVNKGDGTFEAALALDAFGTPTALAIADLDDDVAADLDLAVLVENAGVTELTVFRNDTSNGFLVLVPIEDAQTIFGIPAALASGNADSDGPADLVMAGEGRGDGLADGPPPGTITVHVSVPNQCPGSVNGDDSVDGADLAFVLGEWGPNPGSPADVDGSGVVDGGDLAVILANWGPC